MRSTDRRLIFWVGFVALLSALNYVGRFAGGDPPEDVFYRYSTAVGALVQYAVFGVVVLAIAGASRRDLFALADPPSWGRAISGMVAVLLVVYAAAAATSPFLDPGGEQGLTPDDFDESRASQFFVNSLVVVLVAPVVEELMFRGVGFGLFRRYGKWIAIGATAVAFAAIHGLVEAFPLLFLFGAGLAWLRERTGSVYPCIVLHGFFNGLALVVSVST